MPDDFVNEIYPLNQIRPVSPHPSSVREERRRQKRREQKDRKKPRNLTDRVSLGTGTADEEHQEADSPQKPSFQGTGKKSIDVTV